MMRRWERLCRFVDEVLPGRKLASATLLATLMLAGAALGLSVQLSSPMVRVGLSSYGLGDLRVVSGVVEADGDEAPLVAFAYAWRWSHLGRTQIQEVSNLCVRARPGYLRAGAERIRLASTPSAVWLNDPPWVRPIPATDDPRCRLDAPEELPPEGRQVQRYRAGSSLVLVGRFAREGREWRTLDGVGLAMASDRMDVIREGESQLSGVVMSLLMAAVVSAALVVLLATRMTRRGARAQGV